MGIPVISVDFNDLVRGGQVRADIRDASSVLAVGQNATAVDFFDPDMIFEVTVVSIEGTRAYLRPHWVSSTEVL